MSKINKRMKVDQYEEMELRLEGWGFDVDALRASEGGVSPLLDRRSPRAFSTNVSNDPPNYCHYSGLVSTSSYME